MKITEEIVRKVSKLVDYGLVCGVGSPDPGQMCVEAAVCYALGEPHGDRPSCVHNVIRQFKITLNDSRWSSHRARATGLKRVAVAQLGSTGINAKIWVDYIIEQHVRQIMPIVFRAAIQGSTFESNLAEKLSEIADKCEKDGDISALKEGVEIRDITNIGHLNNTNYAAQALSRAFNYATHPLKISHAADSVALSANYAAANVIDHDKILGISAEIAVQACIKVNTEGSKFLYLVD